MSNPFVDTREEGCANEEHSSTRYLPHSFQNEQEGADPTRIRASSHPNQSARDQLPSNASVDGEHSWSSIYSSPDYELPNRDMHRIGSSSAENISSSPFSEEFNNLPNAVSATIHGANEGYGDEHDQGRGTDIGETKKRKYTFVNRKSNPRDQSEMRKRWKRDASDFTIDSVRNQKCCSKEQCFAKCNFEFLRSKVEQMGRTTAQYRRLHLHQMLGSDGRFYFDGKRVCSSFLTKAFHFSADLQSSVRKEALGNSSKLLRIVAPLENVRYATQRDAIVSFLERLAERTSDRMPDKEEVHLPFFRKRDVYELFRTEHGIRNGRATPSKCYFASTWNRFCPKIKVRKIRRFAKCSVCEEINAAVRSALLSGENTQVLKDKRRRHMEMVTRERQTYYRKRDKAIFSPSEYCSVIIDGADQSAFGLPHFVTKTKDERGRALKVRLIGILEHKTVNKLHLLTMTEEHETGANHIVESLHRFLLSKALESPLPPQLFIQVDNCTRENKNKFFFAYLESLVSWGVFKTIEAGFLPVGHTHEDVDQAFSRTAERLRSNDAITLDDLHNELGNAYGKNVRVEHMKYVCNWSGLCLKEDVLRTVSGFSSLRYFRFQRRVATSLASSPGDVYHTCCTVKVNCNDEWEHLRPSQLPADKRGGGFIKKTPDLSRMPPTSITTPEGKDDVTKRIFSEEGRVNDQSKMEELYALRDYVYRTRVERAHWNLERCVEYRNKIAVFAEDVEEEMQRDLPGEHEAVSPSIKGLRSQNTQRNKYDYAINSFVVIKADEGDDHTCSAPPFWVAKIVSLRRNKEGVVESLSIHWHQPYTKGSWLDARYAPCYTAGNRSKLQHAWKDDVESDSVVVNFASLTAERRLPSSVRKQLRGELSTMKT